MILLGVARRDMRAYWVALAAWTGGLALVLGAYATFPVLTSSTEWGRLAADTPGLLGRLLPLTAFAAGAAAYGLSFRRLFTALMVTATLSYGLDAVVSPIAVHQERAERTQSASEPDLFGARTPWHLIDQKRYIVANPPERYSLATEDQLAIPPNWLDFRVHVPVALAGFTILNGLLGGALARDRRHMDRLTRRRRLWIMSILSGLGFWIPTLIAGTLVRGSLTISGILAAWLPLAVPLVALLLAYRALNIVERRGVEAPPTDQQSAWSR